MTLLPKLHHISATLDGLDKRLLDISRKPPPQTGDLPMNMLDLDWNDIGVSINRPILVDTISNMIRIYPDDNAHSPQHHWMTLSEFVVTYWSDLLHTKHAADLLISIIHEKQNAQNYY